MKTVKELVEEVYTDYYSADGDTQEPLRKVFERHLENIVRQTREEAVCSMPSLSELKLTEADLARIEAIHRATTRGEWEVPLHAADGTVFLEAVTSDFLTDERRAFLGEMGGQEREANSANAEFVVSAHQAIPFLLADLRTALRLLDDSWQDGSLQTREETRKVAFLEGRKFEYRRVQDVIAERWKGREEREQREAVIGVEMALVAMYDKEVAPPIPDLDVEKVEFQMISVIYHPPVPTGESSWTEGVPEDAGQEVEDQSSH